MLAATNPTEEKKTMKKMLIALFVAGLSFVSFAQEPAAPAPEKKCPEAKKECPRGKKFRGRRHHHARQAAEIWKRYAEINKQLKEKFPQEMAEVDALRKESFEKMKAANEKFAELAKKANIELPGAKMMEFKKKMAEFNKKYEKELKDIRELRKTDKKAAREKFQALLKQEGIEFPKPECKGPKGPRGPKFKGPKGPRKGPRPEGKPAPAPAPAAK